MQSLGILIYSMKLEAIETAILWVTNSVFSVYLTKGLKKKI